MLIVQKVQYKRTQMFNESGARIPVVRLNWNWIAEITFLLIGNIMVVKKI